MIHGLDTGFLIAAEMVEHAEHVAARDALARLSVGLARYSARGNKPTMRIFSLTHARWVIASPIVVVLMLMCRPAVQTNYRNDSNRPAETVDDLIRQLRAPEGKIKFDLFGLLEHSTPMKKLVEKGDAIQPRLLNELNDPRSRNEVAVILGQIGNKDALPSLIAVLPTKEQLTPDEDFSSRCLLDALSQLTGMSLGVGYKFRPAYTPEFRAQWQAWYKTNKGYLYTPSNLKMTGNSWDRVRVAVDVEAKFAAMSTAAYRQEHPWVSYEQIKTWRDDPAYERKLKNFCFPIILNRTWSYHGNTSREAIRSLGLIQDPRALSALHSLCGLADDSIDTHDLLWALEDVRDPSTIPFLEMIPQSRDVRLQPYDIESKRLRAIERFRLLERFGKEVESKPFGADQQTYFMKCLERAKGVEELIAGLCKTNDYSWSDYLQVAGHVDKEPVRACLKQMASDDSLDDSSRIKVHVALARLGEKASIEHLKMSLTYKEPGVRFAAAEGLWALGAGMASKRSWRSPAYALLRRVLKE